MRKVICGLLILLFAVVGCSSSGEASPTPTATAKTPIQVLDESVTTRFTAVWDLINSHTTSITNLGNRVGTLEGESSPDVTALTTSLTALTTRVSGLESLNVSDQISDILAEIAYIKLQLGTPTPTPIGATPTPTPIQCGVQKPSVVTPRYGSLTVPNGSVHFEWTNCANAVTYEFWIGTDPSSMLNFKNVSAPARFLDYPVVAGSYYYWKVVAVSPCGYKVTDAWWFKTQ